ncbi:MAG: hypothetical protein IPN34_23580 [Planctomycetes bacterium]|nr:hypothetical protein [Planctomycetota bacterium]
MSLLRFALALFALLGIARAARAQYPADAVGFQWSGSSGASAGRFCWGFECRPATVRASGGEQVQLLVRADGQNAPYGIFASLGASQCLPIPGIAHALALDFPLYLVTTGTLWQQSPILACPSYFDLYAFTFPSGIPRGASVALQALSFNAISSPALSIPIIAIAG